MAASGYDAIMARLDKVEPLGIVEGRWRRLRTPPREEDWRRLGLLPQEPLGADVDWEQYPSPYILTSYNRLEFHPLPFVNGHAAFGCVDEDGDHRRIWREGDTWYSNYDREPENYKDKIMSLKHPEGGDENIPPPEAWQHSGEYAGRGAPNFRLRLTPTGIALLEGISSCTLRNFRAFTSVARSWVLVVLLANSSHRPRAPPAENLPWLPPELWLIIMSYLRQGDMFALNAT
mmetsp:Transcript_35396/g.92609  ORF Transcript_35396/g.92609 Transcript_35396/m.92609 type:complete len:232 (+) Transcript_35396:278-973(+)